MVFDASEWIKLTAHKERIMPGSAPVTNTLILPALVGGPTRKWRCGYDTLPPSAAMRSDVDGVEVGRCPGGRLLGDSANITE